MQGIKKCFIFPPVKLHQIVSTMVCKLPNLWYNRGTEHFCGAQPRFSTEGAYLSLIHICPVTQKLYDTMTGMQWGKIPDTKGWIVPVEKKY